MPPRKGKSSESGKNPVETDAQLLARFNRVRDMYRRAIKSGKNAKWAGSLNFTLLGIKSEIDKRGLNLCGACEGSGVSSSGWMCYPCNGKGRK